MNKYFLRIMLNQGENPTEIYSLINTIIKDPYIWTSMEDKNPIVMIIFDTDTVYKIMAELFLNLPDICDTVTIMKVDKK